MSVADEKNLYDGFASLEGGIDSGRSAVLIAANQCSWSVNNTFRGGYPQERPGFHYKTLSFQPGIDSNWAVGIYQGDGVWYDAQANAYNVAQIGGRVYLVNLQTFKVSDITPVTDPGNSPTLPHAWVYQVGSYAVVQNGQNAPILYNGGQSRRSILQFPGGNNGGEVPVGGPGVVYNGRLWTSVAVRGMVTGAYRGSDLAYAPNAPGTTASGLDNMINFTDTTYLAEGGDFTVQAPITGMYAQSELDTSQSFGDLVISTANNVFAFNAPIDRTTWASLTYPIQRIILKNQGALSHESMVGVNSDIFFRSSQGIYDLVYARREFGTWGTTPISRQVQRALQWDAPTLLGNCKAVQFDNRLLTTILPQQTPRGVAHLGLVALDFDLISGIGQKLPPAWEGVWTGLKFLSVFTAVVDKVQKCFAYALNSSNGIELWQITKTGQFDVNASGVDVQIPRVIETRSMSFNNPTALKRLRQCETWMTTDVGTVTVNVSWNTDLNPVWHPWGSWTECAAYDTCTETDCAPWINYQQQVRNRFGLFPPTTDGSWDDINKQMATDGYQFQLRFDIVGASTIQALRLVAENRNENLAPNVPHQTLDAAPSPQATSSCPVVNYCPPSDFTYILN